MAVDSGSGAWEVAGNPGYAGGASEARAGLKTLSSLSRGRRVLVQAAVGVLRLALRCSGRVARGDGVNSAWGIKLDEFRRARESGTSCG